MLIGLVGSGRVEVAKVLVGQGFTLTGVAGLDDAGPDGTVVVLDSKAEATRFLAAGGVLAQAAEDMDGFAATGDGRACVSFTVAKGAPQALRAVVTGWLAWVSGGADAVASSLKGAAYRYEQGGGWDNDAETVCLLDVGGCGASWCVSGQG